MKNDESVGLLDLETISHWKSSLSRLGPQTQKALSGDWITHSNLDLRNVLEAGLFHTEPVWQDDAAAKVLAAIGEAIMQKRMLPPSAVKNWLKCHKNDPDAVLNCVEVQPEKNVIIQRRIATTGQQKLVFEANWDIGTESVVLKVFRDLQLAQRTFQNELRAHPLAMAHPNIIETHFLQHETSKSELTVYLIEKKLDLVLEKEMKASGIDESANLIYDLAKALSFMEDRELIHGDIKPENIGYHNGRYILLDFGVCRKSAESQDLPPSGSLRTSAPELLGHLSKKQNSYNSDVWALGATVFNMWVERFPLIKFSDDLNWSKNLAERKLQRDSFRAKLAKRVMSEWRTLVKKPLQKKIPDPLRKLLEDMLSIEGKDRPNAKELVHRCEEDLAAYVRPSESPSTPSLETIGRQLAKYFPDNTEIIELIPEYLHRELKSRLSRILSSGAPQTKSKLQRIEEFLRVDRSHE